MHEIRLLPLWLHSTFDRSPCAAESAVCVQATPPVRLPQVQLQALTERIQDAGTEVVKAKVGLALHATQAHATSMCMLHLTPHVQHDVCAWPR